MSSYQFKKHYYIRGLSEPLLCLFLCIPFWIFKDSIPDHLWGKAFFLIAGIPFLLIWLADRIYKVIKHPNLFVFDLTSNSLTIDNANYAFDDLNYFYISEKEGAFTMEFSFPSPKTFEAGYNLKTLAVYKIDSSLEEFNDSIRNMKHIKTYSSD
ncbi:hypothetical protein CXF85_21210 [Colwellia sp. 75C3]|uniref:hypothetical protein n=1 Tax=Colwellia sp. 75C3 TaxID=888425 RepID=UPI000C3453AE|nr:hypothetical protein [Colwellia sp. 75C3]PKG80644.1 hypothetical protein CXF85_21210 [Colwellia sp. 75C3]